MMLLIKLPQQLHPHPLIPEFRRRGSENSADGSFARFIITGIDFICADEFDAFQAPLIVVLDVFCPCEGPVAVGDVGEVGGT